MSPCAVNDVSAIPGPEPELHEIFEQVSKVLEGSSYLESIAGDVEQLIKTEEPPSPIQTDISFYRQDSGDSSEEDFDDYNAPTPFTHYSQADTHQEILHTQTNSFMNQHDYWPAQFEPYHGYVETLHAAEVEYDRRDRSRSESSSGYSSDEDVMGSDEGVVNERLPMTIHTGSSDDEERGRYEFWTPHSNSCKECERPGVCDGKCMGKFHANDKVTQMAHSACSVPNCICMVVCKSTEKVDLFSMVFSKKEYIIL